MGPGRGWQAALLPPSLPGDSAFRAAVSRPFSSSFRSLQPRPWFQAQRLALPAPVTPRGRAPARSQGSPAPAAGGPPFSGPPSLACFCCFSQPYRYLSCFPLQIYLQFFLPLYILAISLGVQKRGGSWESVSVGRVGVQARARMPPSREVLSFKLQCRPMSTVPAGDETPS